MPLPYDILVWFEPNPNLPAKQYAIAEAFEQFVEEQVNGLVETSQPQEVAAGLRKILEAKDCFVRASLR